MKVALTIYRVQYSRDGEDISIPFSTRESAEKLANTIEGAYISPLEVYA